MEAILKNSRNFIGVVCNLSCAGPQHFEILATNLMHYLKKLQNQVFHKCNLIF